MLLVQIPINLLVIISQNTREVWKRRAYIKAQVTSYLRCKKQPPKLTTVIPTQENPFEDHTILTVEDLSGPSRDLTLKEKEPVPPI